MTISKGAEALAQLCMHYGSQTAVARIIGTDQSVVSRWVSGKRTPDAAMRIRLAKAFRIHFTWWENGT